MYKNDAQGTARLKDEWKNSPRWHGIKRTYSPEDVAALQGSLQIEYTLARTGAAKLWKKLHDKNLIRCLGALSGSQAVQQIKAGLEAIYVSGWQVAADANQSGNTYPDQSLYPANSVPLLVERINKALQRADQIQCMERSRDKDFFAPIVADAEAGFGGHLNAFELMKSMIAAGAAGVHFEDQVASEKKCGHLGGKVLVSTASFVKTLNAARLASDVMEVPTLLIARTDAESARLITSDIDENDRPYITGERSSEGYYYYEGGEAAAIARALSFAPHADILWWETSKPCIEEARRFADAIHASYPGKLLAYNCSPSFNWTTTLSERELTDFQHRLAEMGYVFQFVTLAGFHALNYSMFELASAYSNVGMAAYAALQGLELELQSQGYSAVKHQQEVGTGYFDKVNSVISQGTSSTLALKHSTETSQFKDDESS